MKYFFYFLTLASLILTSSCEGDDDGGMGLIYEICDTSLSFTENDKSNLITLSTNEIPSNIRSYIAGEFAGYSISSATSFDVQTTGYIEVIANNGGRLLFDGEGSFLCGDDSFSQGGYDDEDDDEEYINPSDLPQAILDYIAQNYPNATIDEAELEDGEYEIELDNGVELCFDLQGNFLGNDC